MFARPNELARYCTYNTGRVNMVSFTEHCKSFSSAGMYAEYQLEAGQDLKWKNRYHDLFVAPPFWVSAMLSEKYWSEVVPKCEYRFIM